jgi:heme-degrading monooxygenase HmoA
VIVRSWRGWTAAVDADRYLDYLHQTGVREYRETPGNLGVVVLRRTLGERTEFLLLSVWTSMEAVRAFAGTEPERAVFYPEDDAFLVERDLHVEHYDAAHLEITAD